MLLELVWYHLRSVILILLKDIKLTVKTATWTSTHEGSLLFISEISEVDSAKFNKFKSLGGRKYR